MPCPTGGYTTAGHAIIVSADPPPQHACEFVRLAVYATRQCPDPTLPGPAITVRISLWPGQPIRSRARKYRVELIPGVSHRRVDNSTGAWAPAGGPEPIFATQWLLLITDVGSARD